MADLFEQLVADYLTEKGYFTKLNVKFRRGSGRQTASDIDVLAIHGKTRAVIVGDCKAWQGGFWGDWMLGTTQGAERQRERFKVIFEPDWALGLANKVQSEFGTSEFTYVIYCTKAPGVSVDLKKRTVAGNPIEIKSFVEIVRETVQQIAGKKDESVEATTLGRWVQLCRAAGITLT